MNIGRSTISRHLADLELRLGIRLCERGPGGFALTVEGERVLEASAELLASINTFQAKVDDVHQRLKGHLSIALFDKSVSNPEAQLPKTIGQFDEIAPGVTIEVHSEPTNIIETGVLSGRFHLGIIPIHRQSSSMDYYPLYDEEMYLYCGAGHPLFEETRRRITKQEIRHSKYAGIGFHSPNMMVSHQLGLKRSADVYDEEALASLILSGRYLGFLPDHYAENFVARGSMRRLRPDAYHYRSNHSAIVRHAPAPSKLVEAFLNCLRTAHAPGSMTVAQQAGVR